MIRPARRVTLLTALLLVPNLLLLACGGDDDDVASEQPSDGAATADAPETVSGGALTVCSDTPYEPFEFKDDAGEDTGYDIDLLRAIAAEADLGLEVKDLPFDGILGSLAAGDCDVVGSAVTITEERAEQVDFSEPYFDADQSLLVKAGDGEISEITDLAGKTVGVQSGTTGETYANENAEGAEVKGFEDSDGLFAAIEAGEIAAILQDLPVNAYRTTQDDSLEVVETYTTGEQYGFAVAKGNEPVLSLINDGLATLREDGRFDEIYASYFGDVAE